MTAAHVLVVDDDTALLNRRVKERQLAPERCASELERIVEELRRELRATPARGEP
jgi:hypothetical protein